jgi:hypothetical protein
MLARTVAACSLALVMSLGTAGITHGTPVAPSHPKVLYRTTWPGGAAGWTSAGPTWTYSGGLPTYSGADISAFFAPYRVARANYVIEASIRLQSWKTTDISDSTGFGIVLRSPRPVNPANDTAGLMAGVSRGFLDCGGYYSWAVIGTADTDLQVFKESINFRPGNGWHAYRVEVRGNRISLSIDGKSRETIISNRYAGGSRVGLFSLAAQIQVKTFSVQAL